MTLGNEGSASPPKEIEETNNNEMKAHTGASDSFAGNIYYNQFNDVLVTRDPLEASDMDGNQVISI